MPSYRNNHSRRPTVDLRILSNDEITSRTLRQRSLRQTILRTFNPVSNHTTQLRTYYAIQDLRQQVETLRRTTLDSLRRISDEASNIDRMCLQRFNHCGTTNRIATWARVTQAHNRNIFPGGPPSFSSRNTHQNNNTPILLPVPPQPNQPYCLECHCFGHNTWNCAQYICDYCLTAQPGHPSFSCPQCPEEVRLRNMTFVPPHSLNNGQNREEELPAYSRNDTSSDSIPSLIENLTVHSNSEQHSRASSPEEESIRSQHARWPPSWARGSRRSPPATWHLRQEATTISPTSSSQSSTAYSSENNPSQ